VDAKALRVDLSTGTGRIFFTRINIMERTVHYVSDEPVKMPFKLLQEITNNFGEDQRIGNGAFGEVYKVCSIQIIGLQF
jgi:hypothetical protein